MASTRGFDPVRSLENRGRNLCGVTAVQRGEIGDRAQDQGTRTEERKTGGDSRWLLPGDLTPCAAWKTGAGTSAESPPFSVAKSAIVPRIRGHERRNGRRVVTPDGFYPGI